MTHATIVATDRDPLRKLVLKAIKTEGSDCNLNHIDVSGITDMTKVFHNTSFIGNISEWDTSRVQSMESMFSKSVFNGNISRWNTENVQNMQALFMDSRFNSDISGWNVSRVTNTQEMFRDSLFSGDLSAWELHSLTLPRDMFKNSVFQGGMPKIPVKQAGYLGGLPLSYRGSMNDYYSLATMMSFFKQKRWVDLYLERTFVKRIDRVHIEKLMQLNTPPKWCNDKALFNWVTNQQIVCDQLGLNDNEACSIVLQQYRSQRTATVLLDGDTNTADLFSIEA